MFDLCSATFQLSDKFIAKYAKTQPQWGPLGYITYKRTYARSLSAVSDRYNKLGGQYKTGTSEEFWLTLVRVVEGCYRIQESHCKALRLPWSPWKAQKSAQTMFKLMWNFKFLPPGRGLWMMGTPYIEKKLGAPLNNPLREDTKILTKEHGWIKIGDIEGQDVTVLSSKKLYGREHETTAAAATWVPAKISSVEEHPCYSLSYEDKFGHSITVICSTNHRWFRKQRTHHKWERVSIEEMQVGNWLPMIKPAKNYLLSHQGCQHGFFFGDGTRSNGELHQFDDSIVTLKSLFTHVYDIDERHAVVRQCPLAWGRIPQGEYLNDIRYLYGFLAGYVAADGHVDKSGNVTLSSSRLDELKSVRQLFATVGVRTSECRLQCTKSNLVDERNPLYQIVIHAADLDAQFFLKENARRRWQSNVFQTRRDWLKVTDIHPIEGTHRVLCATVPHYEQFVVEGFCLTSNCAFVSTNDLKTSFAGPFCFLMDMSMLGVGVGGDTQGAGTILIKEPRVAPGTHEVTDDREGWVEVVRRVLDAYVGADTIPENISYDGVRPLGSAINGFGGVASGPEPLDELVKSIQEVLTPLIGEHITSTAIVDVFNLIGRCVVSGNVRRSAEIMFGDPDDEEFFDLKNKEIWPEECKHHRWASNNSITAEIGMDYAKFAERTGKNGEPGYLWLKNAQQYSRLIDPPDNKDYGAAGANPCVEQTLESYEMCCLVETFPSRHETYQEYELTLKYAYLYAKTVTLMPTHDERTNAVAMRNRRIGCSQSGIVQAFQRHGRREMFRWCDEGFKYIGALDRIYARWLCVPESIKKTSIKPSGTISLLPGVTPGIHYPHSAYYFRVIRFASDSPLLQRLNRAGYRCEPLDPQKEPNTTAVYFAIKEEHFDRAKVDVSMWEQLENAAQYQAYWADNQVSCTVTFREHEAGDIKKALELYETRLKGISFLPLQEHGYEHAPYQEINEATYKKYISGLKKLKLNNIETEVEDKFCDGEACEIKA